MSYFDFLTENGTRLLDGTIVTVQQTGLAIIIAVTIAVSMGLMRLSGNIFTRGFATCYIELFRGTSLLVQLYWIFFVLPLFGLTMEKFVAGFMAVGMNLGAYGAEVVRGAIQSVPRGQYEASTALNLSPFTRMRRIIFPQAISIMIPQWGNLLIELLKATALVSLISVADLMFESKQINSSTFMSVEAFGTALIIYYILARFVITPVMRWFEGYMARQMGRVGGH